jgi:hypothetical protein
MTDDSLADWLAAPAAGRGRHGGSAGRDRSDHDAARVWTSALDRPAELGTPEPDEGQPSDAATTRWSAPRATNPGQDGVPEPRWRPDPAEVEEADRSDRARRLWRIAAAAWVAVVLVGGSLAVGGRLQPIGEVGVAGAPSVADEPPAEEDAAGDGATTGASGADPTTGGGAATAGGAAPSGGVDPVGPPGTAAPTSDTELGALAVIAVRLGLPVDEGVTRYVDLAQAETFERHGDVTVVTVAAVLLEGTDEAWETARPARYGVAVVGGGGEGGPAVLGSPWPLPAPAGPGREAGGTPAPLEDPELASRAASALVAAGYGDPTVLGALGGAPPPLLRLRIAAAAPGERARREHDVWLHTDGALRVLGAPT